MTATIDYDASTIAINEAISDLLVFLFMRGIRQVVANVAPFTFRYILSAVARDKWAVAELVPVPGDSTKGARITTPLGEITFYPRQWEAYRGEIRSLSGDLLYRVRFSA